MSDKRRSCRLSGGRYTMNVNDFWSDFVKSGRVEDYLKYAEFKDSVSEEANASEHEGNYYQGTNRQGE